MRMEKYNGLSSITMDQSSMFSICIICYSGSLNGADASLWL